MTASTNTFANLKASALRRLRRWAGSWCLITIGATLAGAALAHTGLVEQLNGWVYDRGATSRPARPTNDIAIVGLTEPFMRDATGEPLSLTPRDRLAKLINIVAAGHPAVIVIDVWLDSRYDTQPGGADAQLRDALAAARQNGVPVLLASVAPSTLDESADQNSSRTGLTTRSATLPYFTTAASGIGGVDFVRDPDGVVRNVPQSSASLPSLVLLAAQTAAGKLGRTLPGSLPMRLNAQPVPIDFHGGPGSIDIKPAVDLLAMPFLSNLLTNKIVLIGATYPRSGDLFNSPYQLGAYKTAGKAARRFYGVELQAQSVATIWDGAPRRSGPASALPRESLVLGVLVAALATALGLCGTTWGLAGLVVLAPAVLWASLASATNPSALWHFQYWQPALPLGSLLVACACAIAYREIATARELHQVKAVFAGHVSDEVLGRLRDRMGDLGGEVRQVTVLFCDIEGFTGLSEKLRDDPKRLLALLNHHFEPLVQAIKARGGYADNYVGDLVMAVFGAPAAAPTPEEDARNGVLTALDFLRIVDERGKLARAADEPEIRVGIGLHHGPAVVGYLGTRQKLHYTAIGDTVNIASRVESSTRKYDTHLLVTEEVVQACQGDAALQHVTWEFVDETTVKNRVAPVRLYRVSA